MAEGGQRSQVNLSCSVCLEEFRTPKVLSCGHTYCLRCIDRLVERNGPNISLQCPVCRTQVTFPASGRTEDLITNFQLLSMLNQSPKLNPGGTQQHQLTENSDQQEKEETYGGVAVDDSQCNVHGSENKLYCQTCRVPVCVNCTLDEHDVDSHDIVSKKNYVKEQRRKVQEIAEKLPGLRASYDELAQTIEMQKERHTEESCRLEREVNYALTARQRALAEEASNLLRAIAEYRRGPEQRNQGLCSQLTSQGVLLEATETGAKGLEERLNAQRFTDEAGLGEIMKNVATMEKELESIQRDFRSTPSKPGLVFQPSDVKEKLGYLIHQPGRLLAHQRQLQPKPQQQVAFARFPQTRLQGHLMPPLQGRVQPTSRVVPHMAGYLPHNHLGAYNYQYPLSPVGGSAKPHTQGRCPSSPSGSEVSSNVYGPASSQGSGGAPDTWTVLPGNENWILKADENRGNGGAYMNLLNLSDFT